MAARKKAGFRLTLDEYAVAYHCTVSTVAGWRALGAPLDDPRLLIAWLVRRRSPLPRRLAAQFRFGSGLAGIVAAFDRLAARHRS